MGRKRAGYIFVETVVAMGVLSISVLVVQAALRQGILTRAQAQDYTTARFLLEQVAGEQALLFQQPEGSGSGDFDAPYDNYHFEEKMEQDDIFFPYQLIKGPATTRNAIALLRILGYDPGIVSQAEEMAKRFLDSGEWSVS